MIWCRHRPGGGGDVNLADAGQEGPVRALVTSMPWPLKLSPASGLTPASGELPQVLGSPACAA